MENLLEIFVSKKNKPTLSESVKYFCNIKKDDQKTKAQSTNTNRTYSSPSLFAWSTGETFIPAAFVVFIKMALPEKFVACL